MKSRFKEHITQEFPQLLENAFLLACSGGMDSMVLLHLCYTSGLDFHVAHANFGLRGEESDQDEEFVRDFCKEHRIPFHVNHFDTLGYVSQNKVSVQVAARNLRYEWFHNLLKEKNLCKVVTAHHSDDDLETFLINLSRGTGLFGLSGIPENTAFVARPLLQFDRDTLEEYAVQSGLSWREDSSNEELKYLRNRIRKEIVPPLKKTHPGFMQNFQHTLNHLQGSTAIIRGHIAQLKNELFRKQGNVYRIDILKLKEYKPLRPYLHYLFEEYGFVEGKPIEVLLNSGSGKMLLSHSHRLIKDREDLLLQPLEPENSDTWVIPAKQGEVKVPVHLLLQEVDNLEETGKNILYVDKEKLNKVLTLRKWEKGDYFCPFGLAGKKKVSKFFKDEKMDLVAKEGQWLLCSGDSIVWIVGRRPDERFRVRENTKNILKITWVN
ncbi:MAG: tRNA lysidine(34) synthetase TilS [Flavobacteriaceae bacterium]|nr:tRNA lysidine(34) synthetase TilS [Flavobacteriaceae bacterium]